MDVTRCAVGNHAAKENGVEPREGAVEASDQTPGDGEPGIGSVVNLAGKTVPAIN